MIQPTAFGVMAIDGRTYASGLILFPDAGVKDGWWRQRGHVLCVDDIQVLVDATPELIVLEYGIREKVG